MDPDHLYIIVSSVFVAVIGIDVYNWFKGRKLLPPEIRLQLLKRKINNTVLILGFTMLIASLLFHVNILRYSAPIPFADIETITLKDFKGYRKPYQTLHGESEFAFITTTISWETSGDSILIQALFHPARSYAYNSKKLDRLLLTHELYHFKVTEVFARKCRQQLSVHGSAPSEHTVRNVVAVMRDSAQDMQLRYDRESYHGYLMKEQKKWQKKIDSLLTLLDPYKTPVMHYE